MGRRSRSSSSARHLSTSPPCPAAGASHWVHPTLRGGTYVCCLDSPVILPVQWTRGCSIPRVQSHRLHGPRRVEALMTPGLAAGSPSLGLRARPAGFFEHFLTHLVFLLPPPWSQQFSQESGSFTGEWYLDGIWVPVCSLPLEGSHAAFLSGRGSSRPRQVSLGCVWAG